MDSATLLICDAGFEDVLTLGRQNRADPYALHVGPSPWASRLPDGLRIGIGARMDAQGQAVRPFDDAQAEALRARLDALGPKLPGQNLPHSPGSPGLAVAICLLHALRNPAHEAAAAAVVRAWRPDAQVLCSHQLPGATPGEFERSVATLCALRPHWAAGDAGSGTRSPATGEHPFDSALQAIADAMQATLSEQAVSSIAREAMDCAAAIFLPDGRMVAQARSLPLLLGSLSPAVRGLLAAWPAQSMRDGDGFLCNDPWHGGTHLPDITVLRPVLHDGRVRALVACILHHQDVGGIAPGSVPTDATCIQHEGLRLPPVQAWHAHQSDAALMRLLQANSRMPDALAGDLAAQWAALGHGAQALPALIDGTNSFEQACELSLRRSEAATRATLAATPDGDYAFDDALDGDGITPQPVAVRVLLRKRGDTVEVDLRGCADQTRGPVNASRAAVWAAVSYFARMLALQSTIGDTAPVAANDGCTAPLRLLTRPGSIVDPAFPAAVNARTNLVKLLANALIGAWARARPQASPAPNAGEVVVLSLSGTDPHTSAGNTAPRDWVFTEIIASAAGGAPWGPGGSGVATDVGNTRNTPVEVIEAQAPIRMREVALRRGSGGAGTHAGGDGVVRAYQLLRGEGGISYRGERHHIAAQGAAGGRDGLCASARIERASGEVEHLGAKTRTRWAAGDTLFIETAGGGGWGPP